MVAGLARDLVAERQARMLAEQRADMAARVHDSVLQTLALIQRSAANPAQVVQLARAQERELRSWLFEGRVPGSFDKGQVATLASGVALVERQVEAAHGVAVDAITVGDSVLDDRLQALLEAAREATVNAAKWSGAPTVSIFAEVEPGRVCVFVRDRGKGFELELVGPDSRGIAESITGRMIRHGGTAHIRTAPGEVPRSNWPCPSPCHGDDCTSEGLPSGRPSPLSGRRPGRTGGRRGAGR